MLLLSMTRCHFWRAIVFLIASGFFSPFAFAQTSLSKTTLGKSNNTAADLANSLVPGQQRVDKGEKKSEVDPKTLQSKTVKDTTFQGSLSDIGLDWSGSNMGKLHGGSDAESKPVKEGESAAKDSKVSNPTVSSPDKEKTVKSAEAGGDVQKKDERASTDSGEKAAKPGGNH